MKIYLDIDGVLLTKQSKPANYFSEFIEFVALNFDCFWLTTHCKGKAEEAVKYLLQYAPKESFPALLTIKPTNWNALKTEAIDFKRNFLWIDDYVMEAEKKVLLKNNCLQNLILIDLVKKPDELHTIYARLQM